MAVISQPASTPGRQAVLGPRVVLVLRLLAAAGLLIAWTARGLPTSWEALSQAVHTPSAAQVPYDRQRSSLEGYDLYQLLLTARDKCPPDRNVLALSGDIRADQQGDYVLYPRRVDVVRMSDPFGPAVVKTHAGGCVFFYGADAYQRFAPFQAYLSRQITCVQNGCLYLIKEAS